MSVQTSSYQKNSNLNGPEGESQPSKPLTPKDFVTDQDVRWCPGCGDYSVLAQVQRIMPKLGIERHKTVFVAGIGCSSRFPYYMDTYGFHTIHGRAPAVATGIKCANPDLSVWVITGDGDGLSIGGNHLLHCCRRNVDLNILLFNNRVYGLTKGQYSPTSELGKILSSTPHGSIDYPINPLCVALASEATFVARSVDIFAGHLQETLLKAAKHKGVSFVEIYQNCNIFNDKTFDEFTNRTVRDDRTMCIEHDQPLRFGKELEYGIRMKGLKPEVVKIADIDEKELYIHNENDLDPTWAYLLTQMNRPEFPVPIGVFRSINRPTYDDMLHMQIKDSITLNGKGDLEKILTGTDTYKVISSDKATICPACGHENLPGADTCVSCHQDLSHELLPQPTEGIQKRIMAESVMKLDPPKPIVVKLGDKVKDVMAKMKERPIGGAVVVDENGRIAGIFSDRDVMYKVDIGATETLEKNIEELMTHDPVCLLPNSTIAHALNKMSVGRFRHIPLIKWNRRPIAIITPSVLFHYLCQPIEEGEDHTD